MNKRDLSERDICTKYITPALERAGWDRMSQMLEEHSFTKGRIIVRGKMVLRGSAKRADYILQCKKNMPITVIEAKDNRHSLGDGMKQALDYAETLDLPFTSKSRRPTCAQHPAHQPPWYPHGVGQGLRRAAWLRKGRARNARRAL